uniref:Uncharacterized protein n=1 Tax=Panagrolaimus sp. ES5 TaxID=591445 RepID=A0AC34F9W7_9BILA
MSADPAKTAAALKNALSIDVQHDGDGNFIAELKHEQLEAALGSGVVQQALVNSKYTIVPAEHGFAVSHNHQDAGKLFASDKKPKKRW